MADLVTLADLTSQVRFHADMPSASDQFVSDSQIETVIDASYAEFYDLLISPAGWSYFTTPDAGVTVSGTQAYALPDDFYKMSGVDVVLGGGITMTAQALPFVERNRFNVLPWATYPYGPPARYIVIGAEVWFYPLPNGVTNFTLWYIPKATRNAGSPSATYDFVSGWQEFVVFDAVCKLLSKEQNDLSYPMARRAELKQRIIEASADRDVGTPPRVSRARFANFQYGIGGRGF